jgi:hypothetical protein
MSWLYSRALVEAYSAGICSAGGACAPWSASPMPQVFSWPDRMTGFSRLSRFGMTCELLTGDHGAGLLTWFLAGFPARTSARRERARVSTGSEADCGRRWGESLARWDRDSCSWRTHQFSLLGGLELFSETWPRWGMMRGGECWELSMPELRTSENESGLWRSPAAQEPGISIERLETRTGEPVGSMCRHYDKHTGRMAQIGLTQQVQARMWPTPRACSAMAANITEDAIRKAPQRFPNLETVVAMTMWPTPRACENDQGRAADAMREGVSSWKAQRRGATLTTAVKQQMWPPPTKACATGGQTSRSGARKGKLLLAGAVKTFPTPVSKSAKGGRMGLDGGSHARAALETAHGKQAVKDLTGGALNPTWVEWLMGWPLGWTDLRPLGMDRFQRWRCSHGGCCMGMGKDEGSKMKDERAVG